MAKQASKLPRLASVSTLVKYAEHGAHGRHWYTEALPGLLARVAHWDVKCRTAGGGDLTGLPHVTLADYCDVLAITSPRVSVRRNVAITEQYFEALAGWFDSVDYRFPSERLTGVLPGVVSALAHWEATHEIRGPKTRAFSDALQGDPDAVVLDVWMARAFGIDQALFSRRAVHDECSKRVRTAARRLGWAPAEVQAAVWTAWYEDLGRKGETNAVRIAAFLGPKSLV